MPMRFPYLQLTNLKPTVFMFVMKKSALIMSLIRMFGIHDISTLDALLAKFRVIYFAGIKLLGDQPRH
jgi:hypothetical protein